MSKIRIFSKKAFAIGPGAIRNSDVIESIVTVPGTFQSIPEELIDDATFKLAVKAGEIEIVNGTNQKDIENGDGNAKIDSSNEMSDVAAYYENLKIMNKDNTIAEAKKFGVELTGNEKLKEIKKKVFAAYQLAYEDEYEESQETE